MLTTNSSWAAGGRIGYVIPSLPQLLTYVSGGYSQAHFQGVSYVNSLPPVIGANTGLNLPGHTYDGWFLGGGTEYGFSWLPGLFLKTEYRYYAYDSVNLATFCSGPSATGGGVAPSCSFSGPSGFTDHYTPTSRASSRNWSTASTGLAIDFLPHRLKARHRPGLFWCMPVDLSPPR